ncbi:DUF58 domain-containing protein [Calidifontibacter terrae]
MTRRSRFTGRGRAFCSAGVTLFVCGLVLGYPDITRLGLLLLLLAVVGLLLARRRAARVHLEREIVPPVVSVGDRVAVRVRFQNNDRRRTRTGLAQEDVAYVLGDPRRFVLAAMGPGDGQQVDYGVATLVRGEHLVGPVHITITDPFRVTTREVTIDRQDVVTVLPKIVPLGAQRPPGAGSGQDGSAPAMVALHGEEDMSIRAYADGDDLRKVHWPATAHRGELMVRQTDRPSLRSCTLVLDSRANVHAGPPESSSFEWAISALASVAVRMHDLGYLIHLVTQETVDADRAAAAMSVDQVHLWLARAKPGDDAGFERVLATAGDVGSTGSTIVAALGDHLSSYVDRVAGLRRAGSPALGFVLRADTFGPIEPPLHPHGLEAAGWRIQEVDDTTTIAAAWTAISRRSLIRVGSL